MRMTRVRCCTLSLSLKKELLIKRGRLGVMGCTAVCTHSGRSDVFHLKLDQNFAVIRTKVEDMWRELASHKVLAPSCKYARTPEHA
jgi:hypothetical protein